MEELKSKIVFSNDIKEILEGRNALDFNYNVKLDDKLFKELRKSFENETKMIFENVDIIEEKEMKRVNKLIDWSYPHCFTR